MNVCPLYAYQSPQTSATYINKKKRRGILYSLIPISGSRIAFPKDKQRISPRRVYIQSITTQSGKSIIHPKWTLPLPYLLGIKFARFEIRR